MGLPKGDQKPEGRRPKGFWSPEGKPTKPEAKCFAPILNWCNHRTLQDIIRIAMCRNRHFKFGRVRISKPARLYIYIMIDIIGKKVVNALMKLCNDFINVGFCSGFIMLKKLSTCTPVLCTLCPIHYHKIFVKIVASSNCVVQP